MQATDFEPRQAVRATLAAAKSAARTISVTMTRTQTAAGITAKSRRPCRRTRRSPLPPQEPQRILFSI